MGKTSPLPAVDGFWCVAPTPSLKRTTRDIIGEPRGSSANPRRQMTSPSPSVGKLFQGLISRLVLYYALLFLIVWGTWLVLSPATRIEVTEALAPIMGAGGGSGAQPLLDFGGREGLNLPPRLVTLLSAVACIAAVLLTLPIAWVYMFTRQKKGYSQSLVHIMVLLPAIVAAVAVLVRNSIALAFSLAGIVAAVRFRTTLEDSKDAVFVFLVSALGLACGVQLEVAVVLSLIFIVISLTLWQTDFARTPPSLEGKRAEQHLQRVLEIANRTSQFVARLDREVLETMAPEQLDVLATRVRRRRDQIDVAGSDSDEERPKFDGRLTILVSEMEEGQRTVETFLAARTKRWELVSSDSSDGEARLVYAVRPRKGMRLYDLGTILEREGVPFVSSVSAEQ